jgi:hypothetical protein
MDSNSLHRTYICPNDNPHTDRRCSRESLLVVQLRCTLKLTPSHAVSCPTCQQSTAATHTYTNALRADLGNAARSCFPDTVSGDSVSDGMRWTEEMLPFACFDEPTAVESKSASNGMPILLLHYCPSRPEQSCSRRTLHDYYTVGRNEANISCKSLRHRDRARSPLFRFDPLSKEVGLGLGKKRIYPAGAKVATLGE